MGVEIKLNSITGNLNICQLADDTTLFLKTKHEIIIAMNIIQELTFKAKFFKTFSHKRPF
jgi:hypothetical protein